MSPVPALSDAGEMGILPGEALDDIPGAVPAAVIHKDDFVVIAAAIKGLYDGLLEGGYIFGFIIAGYDQG